MPDTIVVNGKKYTGDQFEAGVNQAKYICFSKAGAILGFTKQGDFLAWSGETGVGDQTKSALKLVAQAKARARDLSASDAKLEQLYTKKMEFHRWQIQRVMEELNIQPHETQKITGLKKDINNLLFGSVLGSALLYDKKGYVGDWWYLWLGSHPKLSWYGFNDKVESVLVLPGEFVILHQHAWFQGYALFLYWSRSDLGWFNNLASSAWVG